MEAKHENSMTDTAKTDAASGEPTVFYDGSCPLCRAEIGHYRKQGAEAAFEDVSSDTADLPEGLDRDELMGRFHVRDQDGEIRSGAAAFAALWRATPGWRTLGKIGGVPPFVWIGEGLYRLFLPIRPLLQRFARRLNRG